MSSIKQLLKIIIFGGDIRRSRLNIIKTLYINLKSFPLRDALKLPILIYGKTNILSVGKIELKCKLKRGVISFGRDVASENLRPYNIWDNQGCVIIHGRLIFNTGYLFRNYGVCEFGKNVNLGSNLEVFCQERIVWEDNVRTAANGFYMDTDGHFYFDTINQCISKMTREIRIGRSVWLGNSVKLKKGTIIPNNSIVASFSVLGRDYTTEGDHLIIGGIPAVVLKRGIIPVLNLKVEKQLKNNYFTTGKLDFDCVEKLTEEYLSEKDTNFF